MNYLLNPLTGKCVKSDKILPFKKKKKKNHKIAGGSDPNKK
jgi:hypothetical protein